MNLLGRRILVLIDQVLFVSCARPRYLGWTYLVHVLLHELGALIRNPSVHEAVH
jgi:hypothetical protein